MADEIRQIVVDRVIERLRTIAGVHVVEDMPSGDIDDNRLPALAVYDLGQRPTGNHSYPAQEFAHTVNVEGYVSARGGGSNGGAAARCAANALYGDVVRALMADPSLAGAAQSIEEGELAFDIARLANRRSLGFVLRLNIVSHAYLTDPSKS